MDRPSPDTSTSPMVYVAITIVSMLVIGGIGTGIYLLVTKKPTATPKDATKESNSPTNTDKANVNSNTAPSSQVPPSGDGTVQNNPNDDLMSSLSVGTFPLEVGSKNQKVLLLQKALNAMGAGIKEDGAYGRETQQAICSKAYKYCVAIGLPPIYDKITVDNTLYNKILAHQVDTSMPFSGVFTGQHT